MASLQYLEPKTVREDQNDSDEIGLCGSAYDDSSLGNEYVIGLNAINCATADSMTRQLGEAAGKEKVLDALGTAAAKLREKLGESLPSVQKFDVPLDQAMTSSLEALQAHSLGRRQDDAASIPLFERAIELDPNFDAAYSRLGAAYYSLGQPARASEYLTKAFELRDHATERDKLYIATFYYEYVVGDLEKAIQNYQLWVQSYPRDWSLMPTLLFLIHLSGGMKRQPRQASNL